MRQLRRDLIRAREVQGNHAEQSIHVLAQVGQFAPGDTRTTMTEENSNYYRLFAYSHESLPKMGNSNRCDFIRSAPSKSPYEASIDTSS